MDCLDDNNTVTLGIEHLVHLLLSLHQGILLEEPFHMCRLTDVKEPEKENCLSELLNEYFSKNFIFKFISKECNHYNRTKKYGRIYQIVPDVRRKEDSIKQKVTKQKCKALNNSHAVAETGMIVIAHFFVSH